MSGGSIGSILGGILGFALAPFTGGASLLVTTGLMAAGRLVGGLLDPPPAQQITGPRLTDLGQQTATYGAFIPRVYGKIAVMGNVFWIENNKLKEVATTQSQGGKGGPPEVNTTTYKYYGTFAVGLCEGLDPALYGAGAELVLSKLWVGEKLFYNRYSSDEETVLTSIDRETKFKFYPGTETQLPEPRMEADLGIANTPAYRGLAYLVVYDMDVGAYGNTIAGVQIKAELFTKWHNEINVSVHGQASCGNTSMATAIIGNVCYIINFASNNLQAFDITNKASPTLLASVATGSQPNTMAVDDSYAYIVSPALGQLRKFIISNPLSMALASTCSISGSHRGLVVSGNYVYITGGTSKLFTVIDKTAMSVLSQITLTSTVNPVCVAIKNNYAFVLSDSVITVIDISNPGSPFFATDLNIGGGSAGDIKINNNTLYATTQTIDKLHIVDISNPLSPTKLTDIIVAAEPISIAISDNVLFLAQTIGLVNLSIYDIQNPIPVLITDFDAGDQFKALSSNAGVLCGCISNSGGSTLKIYSAIRSLVQDTETLSNIVNAECLHSNLLDASDLNVSLLTQSVRGYRISSVGSIRGGIEPLQAAWPFDVVQDGYKIKYVPRGGSNVATITYDKLDARGDGTAPGIQISNSREMESQLPAKVSIKYMDINRAYNTGEQYYERINTDAVNHAALEMPIVFNAQEAAGKAQTLAYLYWLERYDISFKLPPEYLQLQPSDVITITTPDASYNLRLKQINYTQDGRLECQAKYNHAALYSPSATGEEGVPPDDTLAPPGTTTYELLDIPCLQDIYNVSGFPVAMTGAKKGWPGGVLARSDDGGASYTTVGAVPSPGAVMGLATNTIGAHNGLLLDKASVLNVRLTKGSLSSVSELQLFNGANHFAYGIDGRWEIIAAQFCVLQGDGSYNLSDFMRGRFGTEIYTGTHATNDNVIYLASASMLFQTLNSSAIGLTRHYKGVNFQSTLDTATERAFIYNGVNLECLSPVYLNGNRHPTTNDWTLDWIRRGRINNEWKDLIDVPVGETSESYEIDIYSSSGFTTVLRTLSGLTSATATYTSAQQVTDFGSNQATIHVKVYQLSSNVGRGSPLINSITR